MSLRRFACFLLGAWMAGSLFMAWVATENFRSVERLLHEPTAGAAAQIKQLGYEGVRQLLRYQVGEQNRFYFEHWEMMQLLLGVLLFGILLFGTKVGRYTLVLPLLMLMLVATTHWLITPQIITLGRSMEYLPTAAVQADENRFRAAHSAYGVIEAGKLVLATVLLGVLVLRSGRSRKLGKEVDLIDHPDYGHVDR